MRTRWVGLKGRSEEEKEGFRARSSYCRKLTIRTQSTIFISAAEFFSSLASRGSGLTTMLVLVLVLALELSLSSFPFTLGSLNRTVLF